MKNAWALSIRKFFDVLKISAIPYIVELPG